MRRINFQDLMRHRVHRILLVSSLYDSFILAEDGQLGRAFFHEFAELDLNVRPDLTRVSTGAEALAALRESGGFDLIVTRMHVGDMDAHQLSRRVKEERFDIPVLLLAYTDLELAQYRAGRAASSINRAFAWHGSAATVLAMVKYVEDVQNLPFDVGVAGVPTIIVVENSVRFYSAFLPVIFIEVFKHMQGLVAEGLNYYQRRIRLRARPKIIITETYEEAWDLYSTYQEHVIGVISDVRYPKDGTLDPAAGAKLANAIRAVRPSLPIMLQSSHPENQELAQKLHCDFLLKGSPTLLKSLRHFIETNFGFGAFYFRLPDGTEVGRAENVSELVERLGTVPAESVGYHASRNHFSTWLKARAEFALAADLRPRKVTDFPNLEALREDLVQAVSAYMVKRSYTYVADFDRDDPKQKYRMARIGTGSLGGKARGLAFANRLLAEFRIDERFHGVKIRVPEFVVLGTDIFDQFLADNGLTEFAVESTSDTEIHQRFLDAQFPDETRRDLLAFLQTADYPIAVRSSGLLEDSPSHPFAGIYETFMLPNNHSSIQVRLTQLISAIKRVYASTFGQTSKSFLQMTTYRLEEEKMAVIIQRLAGSAHTDHFYPTFSGVARTFNFYPVPPQRAEDGIVAVALGLGPGVVDGGRVMRFSPKHPKHVMGWTTADMAVRNSQREFHALRLKSEASRMDLEKCSLAVAEADGALAAVGSTYSMENAALYDGISRPGVRLVTFAPILKHGLFPLAEIVDTLLVMGSEGTSSPVEIEFAVDIPADGRPQLSFLQLRPINPVNEQEAVEIRDVPKEATICQSQRVLGNGRVSDLRDVVVVDFHKYNRMNSRITAEHVAQFNAQLVQAGTPYLLIGIGRWGSADPYLGIPVSWSQIAGARVIVEAGFRDLEVEPSQGSHFFQNLISSGAGYFTVNPERGMGHLDWDWLLEPEPTKVSGCVRHIHFDEPIVVLMSGHSQQGLILKPGEARWAQPEDDDEPIESGYHI